MSGGGLYVRLGADEGFTYTVAFTQEGQAASEGDGPAPADDRDGQDPRPAYGTGATAVVQLAAEVNPARTSSLTVALKG